MTLEELKKEFKNNGFKIDGDSFIHETVEYSTININGQIHKQPHKTVFELRYICEGSMVDSGDSDDENIETLHQFDVIGEGGEPAYTICIRDFEDFTKLC